MKHANKRAIALIESEFPDGSGLASALLDYIEAQVAYCKDSKVGNEHEVWKIVVELRKLAKS